MKALALVLFAVLVLSFIPLLAGQQANALSAITFTSKGSVSSVTPSQFQHVYETGDDVYFLDVNNTSITRSTYDATAETVSTGTATIYGSTSSTYDYSNSTGWTQAGTQVTISGGTLNFATTQGGSAANRQAQHRSITPLSDIAFTALFNFTWTAQANAGTFQIVALTENTSFIGDGSSNDRIAVVYVYSGGGRLAVQAQDGTTATTSSFITGVNSATSYYPKLERTSATSVTLYVYTDAARTTQLAGSPVSLTIPASIVGLDTLQHSNTAGDGTGNTLTATVDSLTLTTSAGTDLYTSAIETDGRFWITGKNSTSANLFLASYNVTGLSQISSSSPAATDKPKDIVASTANIYVPLLTSGGNLELARATRAFGSYTEIALVSSGAVTDNRIKAIVYDGSPDMVYVFYQLAGNILKAVKYTSSASVISTDMTHTTGSDFSLIQMSGRIAIITSSAVYELNTSTDAISAIVSGAFLSYPPQSFSLNSSARTYSSNMIQAGNSTYAIKYIPSSGATAARTGVFIESATTGGAATMTAYNPGKYYFLDGNNIVVDAASASATSWSIKEMGNIEQVSVTGYSEYVGIDLVENTTSILALDVVKLNCDNGNYLYEIQYIGVGSDNDCQEWWTYDLSSGIVPRHLPYVATAEVVHQPDYALYTFEISQADPTVYRLYSAYDSENVDYADFDSAGQLQQRYLYGQCYDVTVQNKNDGSEILFGNICANDAATKSISLASITIPENWLGVTWFANATRDYSNDTNNSIRFDIQKSQSPYNVSIHIVDHIKESLYTYDQWFNFTNRSNMTTITQSGFFSNQTLYITAYENGEPVATRVLGAKSYDIPDVFAPLGNIFGVPIVATVIVGIAAIWRKENAYFGVIVTMAAAGILFTLGMFEVDPAIWAVVVVLGAVGVLFGVKRS